MKFTAEQQAQYHANGYVVIPCPFPQDLTRRCLEAVEQVAIDPRDNTKDGKGNHYRLEPQLANSYWCALDHSLPFLQIELHSEIVELARQLAGDQDIYFRNGGINELAPQRSFVWHRDSELHYVEFMHYFSGATPDNGCLRVVPGSHIGPVDPWQQQLEEGRQRQDLQGSRQECDARLPGEVALELGPSQLLVRSSRLYHATYLNHSATGRLMHHWLFREAASPNHRFRFEDYLTEELIEALTPEQRQVLWLQRDFDLDPTWENERQAEGGQVFWSVL
ncbi:MAG: hypothetical protein GKR89_25325 [Candidatus Latescibacteria bacterium]|nr:hypothetical protein [Candidatus Latescibacterota bacterium]